MPDELTITAGKRSDLTEVTDSQARAWSAGVARGDDAAFQSIYDCYHGRLTRLVIVLTRGDDHLTRETVQTTFLTAARKMKRLESEAHLWNWLARIARQHLVKTWRARGQESVFETDLLADVAAPPPADVVLEETLNQAIQSLDADDRQAIQWHYFENLSHKEIARLTDATPKAVSSRLERARLRLRAITKKLLAHDT